MSDNIPITAGTGTNVATDQLGSGEHVQYMKLLDATPDSTNRAVVSSAGSLHVTAQPDTYLAKAADASSIGDNTVHAPGAGKAVRLHYLCLSANGANPTDVTAIVKLGATTLFKLSLKPGAIWARNIGAGRRYLQGAADAPLVVNLSAAQTVHTSTEYEEI